MSRAVFPYFEHFVANSGYVEESYLDIDPMFKRQCLCVARADSANKGLKGVLGEGLLATMTGGRGPAMSHLSCRY